LRRGFYLTVGTVEKYKTEDHALKAEEGMRLMINDGILRREPVLFCVGIADCRTKPHGLGRGEGYHKRKKRPRVLQVKDAWQILDALVQPFRTIVLIGLCFGLRISEILGLCWTDFDFKRSVFLIQPSAVGKQLNKLKTEYLQHEVPIERGFILELKK
jgi:integrase